MSYFQHSTELPGWVGSRPAGWKTDWLKWPVSLSTQRPTEEEAENLPYIANEDISSWTGKLLRDDPEPADADSRRFRPNDVLFNKLRPYLAKVYHAPFDGVSSGELLCLRPSESVLPRYLFYVVSSKAFVDAVNAETFGSKMPRADWGIVGHQPLPLPPLETQKRISAFLDEKTAQIDGLVEKKRVLLERLAEKRQAIITQAVTKGLNPAAPMKDSGIARLGQIPANWTVRRLRFILDGDTLNGLYKPKDQFQEDGVSFIQMGEAFRGTEFLGETKDRVLTTEAELRQWGLRVGDFLVARRSLVFEGSGKSVLINVADGPYLFESSMIRLRLLDSFLSSFLSFYLQSSVCRAFILAITKQVTISGIDSQQLKSIPVTCPPHAESGRIAAFLQSALARLDEASRSVTRSVNSLQEYRSALITAAVTGQIEGLR